MFGDKTKELGPNNGIPSYSLTSSLANSLFFSSSDLIIIA